MIHYKKILLTLVLLLTVASGAWADDTTVFEFDGTETPSVGTLTLGGTGMSITTVKIHNNTDDISGIKMANDYVYADGKYFTIAPESGSFKKGDKLSIAICYSKSGDAPEYAKAKIFAADHTTELYTTNDGINGRTSADDPVVEEYVLTQDATELFIGRYGKTAVFVTTLKVERSGSTVDINWTDATKTSGTFSMPAGNVTVTPEYYDQATMTDGVLTPATDVAATSDAPLVTVDATKLTGATSLMYIVTTDGTNAPAYDAQGWTNKVPTAEGILEAGDVYVWYYPVGNDNDDPALTYSDGDICAAPLKVTLAAAPTYAVTFAEGIDEPTKWTATPNEGVKKGQVVTVTYTGTKKVIGVKAEKKAAAPATATIAGVELNVESGQTWETIVANNSDKIYLDGDNYVRLTANNTYLFYNGSPAYKTSGYSTTGTYQWLKVLDIEGAKIYYQEGETWNTAISAGRLLNENWFIDSNLVKCVGHGTLYDVDAVSPSAVINANSEYEFY